MLIVYILPPERSKATAEVSGFQPGAVFKDKYFIEKEEGGDKKKSRNKTPQKLLSSTFLSPRVRNTPPGKVWDFLRLSDTYRFNLLFLRKTKYLIIG